MIDRYVFTIEQLLLCDRKGQLSAALQTLTVDVMLLVT
jgi:hypothetical protein